MKTNQILVGFIAAVLLSVAGCKKYEDGPLISFRSKETRVANNWKVGAAYENGNDVTPDYNKYDLTTTVAGEASLTANYKVLGTTYSFTTNGTWTFVDNKEKLSFDFENNDADGVYKILKLEEKEMWLQKESTELHFVPR